MSNSPFVVLDACVLVPMALDDLLLRASEADLYQVIWSDDILDEVQRTLVGDLHIPLSQAERRIASMRRYFPEAMIHEHRRFMGSVPQSVDAKDRHVVAAALQAKAPLIVTSNLRDFPQSALTPLGIAVQSPDDFLIDLYSQDSGMLVEIIRKQASDLIMPPMTAEEILNELALQAPRFVALIRPEFEG